MRIIVIGSSAAAVSFAETFRKESDDEITIIAQEEIYPYFRPMLSHMILSEKQEERFFLKPEHFYEDNDIKLLLGKKVTDIDADKKIITLNHKDELTYDKLILAVGSYNFVPPIEGVDKQGVYDLKYFQDLQKLNEYAKDKKNITVVGGGLLGIEAAWAFHNAGKSVTILEFLPRLMQRQLCEKASELLQNELERIGIKVLLGKSTKKIMGEGKVESLVLESGEEIPTDVLFFSVGVRPNVELAKNAGLDVDRGVLINENMGTSDENIYAIGDCSQLNNMVPGIWPLAMQMGKIAANHILGKSTEFQINPPIAILKALDIGVYSAGDITKSEDYIEVTDGENYKYFSFEKGILTGINLIGNTKLSSKAPKMLAQKYTKEQVEQLIKEN